jgi:hypothetical protein
MRTRSFTAPLRFTRRAGSQDVDVAHIGDSPLPGSLVRLISHHGQVRALAVRPPAPGQTIVAGHTFADAQAGRRPTEETLREIGLTDGEIAAFFRAWDPAIFGLQRAAVEERSEAAPAASESFLYFLSPADCDRISTITFTPPPRTVRRAIAVWSAL